MINIIGSDNIGASHKFRQLSSTAGTETAKSVIFIAENRTIKILMSSTF